MDSHRTAILVGVVAVATGLSCVRVSSEVTQPARDAGRPPRPDTGPLPDVGPRPDAPEPPRLTREAATRGLLAAIGTNVVLPTYRALAAEAALLEAALAAYAGDRSAANLEAARAAWIRIMPVVERAELLQIGPAADMVMDVPGARGLRRAIYFFPTNRCITDVIAAQRIYDDLTALAAEPAYARGLGAIEYQLFDEGTDHGCDPAAERRVDDASWAALGPEGVRQRRAEAALADARLVRQAAGELLAAWEPSGGDFAGELARAGAGSIVYATSQAALNAIYWALFYLDPSVKDAKLGVPIGMTDLCAGAACHQLLESRWAHRSAEHLVANVDAFRDVFLGGPPETEAIGFDDLLRAIMQDELAANVTAAIAVMVERARVLPPIAAESVPEHLAALEALHAAVSLVTSLLKLDVASVLAFTPPPGAGEDND